MCVSITSYEEEDTLVTHRKDIRGGYMCVSITSYEEEDTLVTQRKDLVALLPVNAIPTNIPTWAGQCGGACHVFIYYYIS
jgi:hypothetical protein